MTTAPDSSANVSHHRHHTPHTSAATEAVTLPAWTAWAFLLFCVVLVPWIAWLAASLPSSHTDRFYDVTWVGFDVGLLVALGTVVWLARHRSAYVEVAAAAAGTMLIVDAWFDITTSTPGADRWEAIAAAVLVELPIAALCGWLVRNAESVRRRTATSVRLRGDVGVAEPRPRKPARDRDVDQL